jgi:single-stranded DNA-binding protein
VLSVCVVCGKVENEPELRTVKGKVEHATFNLDLSFHGKNYGYIRVSCSNDEAKLAADYLHPGTKVLVTGYLIREVWKSGGELVWGEVTLTADYLRFIA